MGIFITEKFPDQPLENGSKSVSIILDLHSKVLNLTAEISIFIAWYKKVFGLANFSINDNSLRLSPVNLPREVILTTSICDLPKAYGQMRFEMYKHTV